VQQKLGPLQRARPALVNKNLSAHKVSRIHKHRVEVVTEYIQHGLPARQANRLSTLTVHVGMV
jgi:hypothetical protein